MIPVSSLCCVVLFLVLSVQVATSHSENVTVGSKEHEEHEEMPKVISKRLHKAHGILMLLAWLIFVTNAVIFARYLRGERTWGSVKIWFLVHRALNMIGVALMTAGFLCIFTSESWSWKGPKFGGGEKNWEASALHSLAGLICTILAWSQPLFALMRCAPNSTMRPLFNWWHRYTGVVALLLAVITIIIAAVGIKRWSNRPAALALVIVFIVCLAVAVGAGEITAYLEQRHSANSINIAPSKGSALESSVNRPRSQRALHIILFLYGCISVIIAVILSVLVAFST